MSDLAKFLAEIEAFLVEHDMEPTVFARAATRDKSYVARLREGSGTNVKTMEKVRAFMRDYEPQKRRPRRRAPHAPIAA